MVTLCHQGSTCQPQGGGPKGFGHGKEKTPIAEAEKQLAWRAVEGRTVRVWAGACPVGLSVASNFWRDLTLGTSHSGHR